MAACKSINSSITLVQSVTDVYLLLFSFVTHMDKLMLGNWKDLVLQEVKWKLN